MYISAETTAGASLALQSYIDRINGHETYIVYFDTPIFPKNLKEIVITMVFTDLIEISGTFSAKLRSTGNIADEVIITDGVFKNINYQ